MTALVCGKRCHAFEDNLDTYYPSFKKHHSSSLFNKNTLINQLKNTFPLVDPQTLDKTLQDCNLDLDTTTHKLQELYNAQEQQQEDVHVLSEKDIKWVELFVKEMTCATSLDEAKSRAARILAARDQDQTVTTDKLNEENLKLGQENCVLRRLVVVQHEKLKGYDENKQEVEKLNCMLSKCREELRVSEINNYTLKMHLDQAVRFGGSSLINTFNLPPDVY
ncbi:uncharacterized protein LOC141621077 [Silene latifolia]|uniref:uncharacterized protein LOC141621077 n=1 Tax=Silene latifolia TaxID=37657 RepID=UPI003D78169E